MLMKISDKILLDFQDVKSLSHVKTTVPTSESSSIFRVISEKRKSAAIYICSARNWNGARREVTCQNNCEHLRFVTINRTD